MRLYTTAITIIKYFSLPLEEEPRNNSVGKQIADSGLCV
jgi:hypothetical protein